MRVGPDRPYNKPTMTYKGRVLLEDMNGKLDAILEGQEAMGHIPGDIAQLKEDMFDVKNEIKGMKAAMQDEFRERKNGLKTTRSPF